MKTIKLTELDERAVRSFITWILKLEKDGSLELFDFQRDTLMKLSEATKVDAKCDINSDGYCSVHRVQGDFTTICEEGARS